MAITLTQFIDNLADLLVIKPVIFSDVIVPNGELMLSNVKHRIQKQGKNSADSNIGNYSTKPAYFGASAFVNAGAFQPRGKRAPAPTKNMGKSMYLPHGYKEFRDIQGFETAYVNETLSGATMNAYQSEVNQETMLLGFTTDKSSKIRRGQEKHWKAPIFSPSVREVTTYDDAVSAGMAKVYVDTVTKGN